MRTVAGLVLRDANLTDLDASEKERRIEQFVSDAYYQESLMAEVDTLRPKSSTVTNEGG